MGGGGCKPDFFWSRPRPLLRGLALSGLRESSLPDLGFITLCRSGSTALSQNPVPQEGSPWGPGVSLILLIRIIVQGGSGQHGPFLIKLSSHRSEVFGSSPQNTCKTDGHEILPMAVPKVFIKIYLQ